MFCLKIDNLLDKFYYMVYEISFYISKIVIVLIIFDRLSNCSSLSPNMIKFVVNFAVKYDKKFSVYNQQLSLLSKNMK